MASSSSSNPTPSEQEATYSKMSVADLDAIGSHCQMAFCHQLDFLPFKCESCKGCETSPFSPYLPHKPY